MNYSIHECTTSEAPRDATDTKYHRLVYWPEHRRWTHHWANHDTDIQILVSERRRLITWVDPADAIKTLRTLHANPEWALLMVPSQALPAEIHEAYLYLWNRTRRPRRVTGDSTLEAP